MPEHLSRPPDDEPAGSERLSRDELRELLLTHGRELLLEEGVGYGLDHLGMGRIFDRIEAATGRRLTRSRVYDRVWRNQAAYQLDVLASLIAEAGFVDPDTLVQATEIIEQADRSTAEGRWSCVLELCRVVATANVAAAAQRQQYRIATAATGAHASLALRHGQDEQVGQALVEYLDSEIAGYEAFYQALLDELELTTKPGFTVRHFTLAVGALAEGVVGRYGLVADYAKPIEVPTDDGQTELWSIMGIGTAALVEHMLEPKDDLAMQSDAFQRP